MTCGGADALLLPLLGSLPEGWLPIAPATSAAPKPGYNGCNNYSESRHRPPSAIHKMDARSEEAMERGQTFERALRSVATAALEVANEYENALWGKNSGRGYHPRTVGLAKHTYGGGKSRIADSSLLPRFQRWGKVGVLFISALSGQLDFVRGGREAIRGTGLLPSAAWDWLEDFFRAPEMCLQVYISEVIRVFYILSPSQSDSVF